MGHGIIQVRSSLDMSSFGPSNWTGNKREAYLILWNFKCVVVPYVRCMFVLCLLRVQVDKAHEYILETVKSSDPAVLQANMIVSSWLVSCGVVQVYLTCQNYLSW